jgi:hypothetical protein
LPPPRASYRTTTATATAPHAAVTATWAQVMLREGLGVSISQTIQAPLGFLFAMIRRGPHTNAGRATCGARPPHLRRALMRGWKLSLAMMAVLPLIVVSMGILATVMKSSGEVCG